MLIGAPPTANSKPRDAGARHPQHLGGVLEAVGVLQPICFGYATILQRDQTVLDHAQGSIFLTEKPGLSLPTTKPLTWFEVSSRAQMMLISAKVAFPIHFFSPLSTQASPSRRQVVIIPPDVADPTRGSVRPNEPIFSNRIIAGNQRCFCSSSPQR